MLAQAPVVDIAPVKCQVTFQQSCNTHMTIDGSHMTMHLRLTHSTVSSHSHTLTLSNSKPLTLVAHWGLICGWGLGMWHITASYYQDMSHTF